MNFTIDRDLPVPLGTQLRGLVEYGIACGELAPGSRLPSVRRLALQLDIAPMTVSQVYRELQSAGLIEARSGQGTFVAAIMPDTAPPKAELVGLQQRIDGIIADATALGLGRGELTALFNARLTRREPASRGLRLVLVGIFEEATQAYAARIQARLPAGDTILATTFDRIAVDEVMRQRLLHGDLALTFANRKAELAGILGPRRRVTTLSFIPSEKTRTALAALDPLCRLGIVSTLPEFLPVMTQGVRRHAPHVADIRTAVLGQPELPELLRSVDIIVYATGAEAVTKTLPAGVAAFEYRHVPDPNAIDQALLPLLDEIRAGARAGQREELKEAP